MQSPHSLLFSRLLRQLQKVATGFLLGGLLVSQASAEWLVNGSFESPVPAGIQYVDESVVPGWSTTDPDNIIEMWATGSLGVPSFDGRQHVEINYLGDFAIFQDVPDVPAGTELNFEFAHRGRAGPDTLEAKIVDVDLDQTIFSMSYTTGRTDWQTYGASGLIATGGVLQVVFTAVHSSGPDSSFGNLIDAVSLKSVSTPSLPGDYNGSGSVEQGDLDLVLGNWGGPRGDWSNADGFTSGGVDQEELDAVLGNWGASSSALGGETTNLPEPMAILWSSISLGFLRFRAA